jgi:hypothetical protein
MAGLGAQAFERAARDELSAAAALAAVGSPAWRAARVDAVTALRAE